MHERNHKTKSREAVWKKEAVRVQVGVQVQVFVVSDMGFAVRLSDEFFENVWRIQTSIEL